MVSEMEKLEARCKELEALLDEERVISLDNVNECLLWKKRHLEAEAQLARVRAQTWEEAAKICESDELRSASTTPRQWNACRQHCADAIRQRAQQERTADDNGEGKREQGAEVAAPKRVTLKDPHRESGVEALRGATPEPKSSAVLSCGAAELVELRELARIISLRDGFEPVELTQLHARVRAETWEEAARLMLCNSHEGNRLAAILRKHAQQEDALLEMWVTEAEQSGIYAAALTQLRAQVAALRGALMRSRSAGQNVLANWDARMRGEARDFNSGMKDLRNSVVEADRALGGDDDERKSS